MAQYSIWNEKYTTEIQPLNRLTYSINIMWFSNPMRRSGRYQLHSVRFLNLTGSKIHSFRSAILISNPSRSESNNFSFNSMLSFRLSIWTYNYPCQFTWFSDRGRSFCCPDCPPTVNDHITIAPCSSQGSPGLHVVPGLYTCKDTV